MAAFFRNFKTNASNAVIAACSPRRLCLIFKAMEPREVCRAARSIATYGNDNSTVFGVGRFRIAHAGPARGGYARRWAVARSGRPRERQDARRHAPHCAPV